MWNFVFSSSFIIYISGVIEFNVEFLVRNSTVYSSLLLRIKKIYRKKNIYSSIKCIINNLFQNIYSEFYYYTRIICKTNLLRVLINWKSLINIKDKNPFIPPVSPECTFPPLRTYFIFSSNI